MSANWKRLKKEIVPDKPIKRPRGFSIKDAAEKEKARPSRIKLAAEAAVAAASAARAAEEENEVRAEDALYLMAAAAALEPSNKAPAPLTGKDDPRLTPVLAIDCEMVGVGSDGKASVLAQVCVVNERMETVYVTYVKPKERVTDFRTWVSGVEPKHLRKAPSFESVVKTVSDITLNRVLVGHALKNDLHALMLSHSKRLIRDTSKYPAYRVRHHGKSRPRKLRDLSKDFLGLVIQAGEHDPAEDARAALALYLHVRRSWEMWLSKKLIQPPDPPRTHRALAIRSEAAAAAKAAAAVAKAASLSESDRADAMLRAAPLSVGGASGGSALDPFSKQALASRRTGTGAYALAHAPVPAPAAAAAASVSSPAASASSSSSAAAAVAAGASRSGPASSARRPRHRHGARREARARPVASLAAAAESFGGGCSD